MKLNFTSKTPTSGDIKMFKHLIAILLMAGMVLSTEITICSLEEKHFYGQFIKQIHLEKSSRIKYNWDWIKGTSNITISYTNDIEITNSTANETLKLQLKTRRNTTRRGPAEENSALKASNSNIGLVVSIVLTIIIFNCPNQHRYTVVGLTLLLVLTFAYCSINTTDCQESQVNLTIPFEYVESLCVNQEKCFPIKCSLALGSVFSTYPANNKLLFTGNFCELKKPDRWDEWVQYYFKTNTSTERFYFLDNDNDGLVNFIEYYGGVDLFNTVNDSSGQQRHRRSLTDISNDGTDPMDPDSDDDLLLDGFELSNGMSPKQADDSNADADTDGLTNLKEQIYGTDPLNRDTDGDGVEDGTEVANNADPKDPLDQGQTSPDQSFAMVNLTIGDHSGSHSERYYMTVGQFKHQSPDYGKVGSGVYKYLPGNYTITITHIDSNLPTPDFDYRAKVEKESGNASFQVIDPKGILGDHYESDYDFTLGKTATLIVKGSSKPGDCSNYKTCEKCHTVNKCAWRKASKSCIVIPFYDQFIKTSVSPKFLHDEFRETCVSTKCLSWYNEEKKDTKWLTELNKQIKCPCQAKLVSYFGDFYIMKEVDNPSNRSWEFDTSCTNPKSPGCTEFHPGAAGCIYSMKDQSSVAGPAQQCCYDKNGKLLRAGSEGAGTPDKSFNPESFYEHRRDDVIPYENCCTYCEITSYCNFYINDVRKGDDSHCYS